jgi:hypothetical protein
MSGGSLPLCAELATGAVKTMASASAVRAVFLTVDLIYPSGNCWTEALVNGFSPTNLKPGKINHQYEVGCS